MHTHLSVNPRALNADQDAQVNGEPSRICRDKSARLMCIRCLSSPSAPHHPRAQAPQQNRGEGQDPSRLQVSRSWTLQRVGQRSACPGGRKHGVPTAMGWLSPGAEQSQHSLFPGMPLTSLMIARVSSSQLLSPLPCALLKVTFSASSLLLLRTDTQLHGQKAA